MSARLVNQHQCVQAELFGVVDSAKNADQMPEVCPQGQSELTYVSSKCLQKVGIVTRCSPLSILQSNLHLFGL